MSPSKSLSLILLQVLILSSSPLCLTASSDNQNNDNTVQITADESPVVPSDATTAAIDENIVKAICDKIRNSNLCMTVVMSVASEPVAATDVPTVLRLAILGSIFNTQAIIDKVKVMAKDSKVDEGGRSKLQTCVQGFETAIRGLEDASKAVEENKEGDTLTFLSAVSTNYEQCRTVFEEDKQETMIPQYQDMLDRLSSMTLELSRIIWPAV